MTRFNLCTNYLASFNFCCSNKKNPLNFFYSFEMQNGNVGFMLSCYDAELSYDSSADTFKARYGDPSNINRVELSSIQACVRPYDCLHLWLRK